MLDRFEKDRMKRIICEFGRRMHDRRYVAGTDGNISVLAPGGHILITPSGVCLGEMEPDVIVELGPGGTVIDSPSGLLPTSELRLHIEVYSRRPDIGAVIHAHPVHATALSIPYFDLHSPVLPESLLSFGRIGVAEFAVPTTAAVVDSIRNLIADHDGIIMRRHGTLTVGKDIKETYHRLEALEHTCEIIWKASCIGKAIPLGHEHVRTIMNIVQKKSG